VARAALHLFREQSTGRTDIEIAPAGVLLVIAFGDPYQVGIGDGAFTTAASGFVIGAQSRYGRSALAGTAEGVQVDISWSCAVAISGSELAALGDLAAALPDLAGGAELVDRLPETPTTDRARLVGDWLAERSRSHDGPSPVVERALTRIEDGANSVSRLAVELGCSRGYLHRAVRAATGQSPSTLIRIVRLHRLIGSRAIAGPQKSLARAAAQVGYADHAHLCHEARNSPAGRRLNCSGPGDVTTRPRVRNTASVNAHGPKRWPRQFRMESVMTTAIDILRGAQRVVVQDYPSKEIPDALTRAGLVVMIYGGPDEADVVASELVDGEVVCRRVGCRPDAADLLFIYRPLSEIDGILADARRMGVRTIWRQPNIEGEDRDAVAWRAGVEAAGLAYLDAPNIVELAQELGRTS